MNVLKPEKREEVRARLAAGESLREVAEKAGVAKGTVEKIKKEGKAMPAERCSESGCTRGRVKDGLCYRHYHQKFGKKPWGEAGQARENKADHNTCKFEGCPKYPWRKGYCRAHLNLLSKAPIPAAKSIPARVDPPPATPGLQSALNGFVREAVRKDLGPLVEAMERVINEYRAVVG